MKKMMVAILFCLLTASVLYAQGRPTEEDYRNLDELRAKLVRMRREMDKFMKDIIGTYSETGKPFMEEFGQDVKVDVTQADKEVIVKADLPGMDKDKIDITLENNKILKIAGMREAMKSQAAPGIVKQERMQGKFERVLELPAECMSEGIKATYKNGVLEIVIPKKAKTKEEMIKINLQ